MPLPSRSCRRRRSLVWTFPKWPQGGRNARPPRTPMAGTTAASSGGGLVPEECGHDLPSSAAIQLAGQQGSDH